MACLLGSQSAGMAPALETGTIEQVGLTRGKPHIGWPRVLMTGLLGLSRHVATVHAECDAFSTGKSPALKHSKAGRHSLGQNLPIGSKVLDPSGPEVHLLFAAVGLICLLAPLAIVCPKKGLDFHRTTPVFCRKVILEKETMTQNAASTESRKVGIGLGL